MNLVNIFGQTNDSAKVLLVLTHLPEELQNRDLRLGDQKREQILSEFEEECPAVLNTGRGRNDQFMFFVNSREIT